ncbi:3,4-dihydroxy-5-hexaprenylbenzoate methyltransferase [Heterostelium album PN500]|uniref:Ubiquinone biosynthesis O-methyltransferase, mitochondrial n=1 Tax=Heterostelium pallidum (strain ATCC 26659 / Pp 5 / PN500) TaxID=670386 RepID=D3AZU6_HETP5|nr:3,4-dihydroxy-5-hexaprenylbenzoate methyltransferase [Heterostelium album PN500]EFA84570.1 3,4-dihydroxy-5-hexaprenylbenzoate methyltransferase [Heterostelium album PN500]|eukprot:XP_020436683.1 3,4-dihydroxy-5-hexaprenylbenzoate methyltransferase [Heterostelium album PN500]
MIKNISNLITKSRYISNYRSYNYSTNNVNNVNSNSNTTKNTFSSMKEEEIKFFNGMAKDWWDINGPMRPLHKMNPVRVQYMVDRLKQSGVIKTSGGGGSGKSLAGLKIIDVGCGAGLLTESFSRLGADVVGLDAAGNNISMAIAHAKQDKTLSDNIDRNTLQYIESTVEQHAIDHHSSYDIVTTMEVVEHVENVPEFIKQCTSLIKPGGCFFLSTMNKTTLAYLTTIVGAEYICKFVPVGTHHWDQYVKPEDLQSYLSGNQVNLKDISGLFMNPLTMNWSLINNTNVNYILFAMKSTTSTTNNS